jgi:hypothetical protein
VADEWDVIRARRGDRAMQAMAARVAPLPLPAPPDDAPPCRFLTGERFAHQTVFCARSFEWACGTHCRIEIFTDGSLRSEHAELMRRAFPCVVVHDDRATRDRLEQHLPLSRFPRLRAMREHSPLMRKVIDLHAGFRGPSLSLDSDMLFFRRPQALIDWMANPAHECYMSQSGDALAADRMSLEKTLGITLLPGVNSGIVAIHDDAVDWDDLERAAAALTEDHRRHWWAEQTLIAYHVSRRNARPLPVADYRLCNSRADLIGPLPVLRHYVHKAKAPYAAAEWRAWLKISATSGSALSLSKCPA